MKTVSVELHNIQSHALTRFKLSPGLTFIISDGNNVGKSTIFRVLDILPEAGYAPQEDLSDLLRGGETSGYACFSFDDIRVVLWLVRQSPTNVVAFFDTTIDGEETRTYKAPDILLEALDLVYSPENKSVVNIVESDKTQFIVDKGAESDNIVSAAMIDDAVENAKLHLSEFKKTLQSDEKMFQHDYDLVCQDLQRLSYNHEAQSYFDELPLLESIANLLDTGVKPFTNGFSYDDIDTIRLAYFVWEGLSNINAMDTVIMSETDKSLIGLSWELLQSLSSLAELKPLPASTEIVSKFYRAESTLSILRSLLSILNGLSSIEKDLSIQQYQLDNLKQDLSELPLVTCPIKGRVRYSEQGCISVSD